MPQYRVTVALNTPKRLPGPVLHEFESDLHKYADNVLMPKDNPHSVVVQHPDELEYSIHIHKGCDNCDYCQALAADEQE